jgi:hypothetical protein
MRYQVTNIEPPTYRGDVWAFLNVTARIIEGEWREVLRSREGQDTWQRNDWRRVEAELPGITLRDGEEIWTCHLYVRDGRGVWRQHPTAFEILSILPLPD